MRVGVAIQWDVDSCNMKKKWGGEGKEADENPKTKHSTTHNYSYLKEDDMGTVIALYTHTIAMPYNGSCTIFRWTCDFSWFCMHTHVQHDLERERQLCCTFPATNKHSLLEESAQWQFQSLVSPSKTASCCQSLCTILTYKDQWSDSV